jgi:hypothetical protein
MFQAGPQERASYEPNQNKMANTSRRSPAAFPNSRLYARGPWRRTTRQACALFVTAQRVKGIRERAAEFAVLACSKALQAFKLGAWQRMTCPRGCNQG